MSISSDVSEPFCFHCGNSLADEADPKSHIAECGQKRLRALEDALSRYAESYATRLLTSRELLAELVIIFDGREFAIRSFVNRFTSGNEITDAVMRSLPDVAADTVLLNRIRPLKEPLISKH